MEEQVKQMWFPQATKLEPIIRPCLARSYQMFLKNNRKDVVSVYVGGNVYVITTEVDGRATQLIFCKEDIPLLPPEAQDKLKKDLKRPGPKGYFRAQL